MAGVDVMRLVIPLLFGLLAACESPTGPGGRGGGGADGNGAEGAAAGSVTDTAGDGNATSSAAGDGSTGEGQTTHETQIVRDLWGPYAPPERYGPPGPYAEALQKSLYFFDINMSGMGITGGRIEWRGNSEVTDYAVPLFCQGDDPHIENCVDLPPDYVRRYIHIFDPDGNGTVNVGGGFHDCGDHVKFGLPQAFAASMLAWAMYEFTDSFVASGQAPHALEILKRFTNYFLRSTFRDESGAVIAFCYQVGVGNIDHNFWGPPELQKSEDYPRPALFATPENPGADVSAAASAALALASLVFRPIDPAYADRCLDTARALYDFADTYRGTAFNGGFYESEYEEDDLAWAAIWLHIATGEDHYLEDIVRTEGNRYTGHLGRIMATTEDDWYNAWAHCWNTVWSGVFVKLAQVTGDPKWYKIADDHANLWAGIDGNRTVTPGGLSWLTGWGSLRYNAAAQMTAMTWGKVTGKEEVYVDWADSQMHYIWGDNPLGKSYIVGFGDAWPVHIHHRAAHGSTKDNSLYVPPTPSHVAWGALLGGPDADDSYKDDIWEYAYTESCIDYSASLVGALAGLYHYRAIDAEGVGQAPLSDFPPKEPEQVEFWVEGKVGQDDAMMTEVKLLVHNESVHPPHFDPLLSIRYYFDIGELVAAGQGIDDIRVQLTYDGRSVDSGMLNSGDGKPTIVTGPHPYGDSGTTFYYEFAFTGCKFYGALPLEFQLVAELDSQQQWHLDSGNDYSRQGLPSGEEYAVTPFITMYSDGALIAGEEP